MHFAAAGFAEASLREWTLDQEASFRKPIQASTNRADHCCFRRYGIRLLAAAANLHDRTRCDCNRIQGTCLWIQIEYCAVVICGIIIVYLVCSPKKIIHCQSAEGGFGVGIVGGGAVALRFLFVSLQTKRFPKFCRVLPIPTL